MVGGSTTLLLIQVCAKQRGLVFWLSATGQCSSASAEFKVGSTLTLRLPLQGGCNFTVGVFYFTVSFSLFCFISSFDSSFYSLPRTVHTCRAFIIVKGFHPEILSISTKEQRCSCYQFSAALD